MERIERAAFGGGVVRRSIAMGIFDWLLSHGDEEEDWTGEAPPLIPSKAAPGRDIDADRTKTQTEKLFDPEAGPILSKRPLGFRG